ncbi:MAG: hypothetical protein F6J95_020130 [Leptolyngbya sp. SIO1E4]|nr:hypothetical protein [Leptolyngbya sp. SIO1E4]
MIKVYAPNLHLFAFHLIQGDKPTRLWDYYTDCLQPHFALPNLGKLRSLPSGIRAYLHPNGQTEVFIPLTGQLPASKTSETAVGIPITGLVSPVQLYDSYGLALNLRIPEGEDATRQPTAAVDLSIFQQFNTEQIFRPKYIHSNLGQTLLLTAWLEPPEREQRENWQDIAQQILANFLHGESLPPLYQAGHLFGSPIYEYGSPTVPNAQGQIEHYLIWLFINSNGDENLNHCYQELFDLWFYRHKITTACHYSREDLEAIKSQYGEIKCIFSDIPNTIDPAAELLSPETLTTLKTQLKALPKRDLEYTEALSAFENRQLALRINNANYGEKIAAIQARTISEDISFLASFGTNNAATLIKQMQYEVGYFGQGSRWIDKSISTIRGLVEIDQAERDLQRRKQEQALQDNISAIGVGVAAGAIVASSSGLIMEPWYWGRQEIDSPWQLPHPFFIGVVGSGILAVIAWGLTKAWLQFRRQQHDSDP